MGTLGAPKAVTNAADLLTRERLHLKDLEATRSWLVQQVQQLGADRDVVSDAIRGLDEAISLVRKRCLTLTIALAESWKIYWDPDRVGM